MTSTRGALVSKPTGGPPVPADGKAPESTPAIAQDDPDGHVTATRRLLRRLRGIMAGSGSAQERLDRIVRVVAAEMVAEVCSAYIMRAGEVLELFATEGLRPEAVHRTRLRVGEGLVGVIAASARPLALADARSHPDFAYRPETGEEIYHSLMGVPILRGGRVLGILVVQIIRQRVEGLYATLVGARVMLCTVWMSLFLYTRDPFFLIVFGMVAVGMVWTAVGLVLDRRTLSQ